MPETITPEEEAQQQTAPAKPEKPEKAAPPVLTPTQRNFKLARNASTPIISITTPDAAQAIDGIKAMYSTGNDATPIILFDLCRGVSWVKHPESKQGKEINQATREAVMHMLCSSGEIEQLQLMNPAKQEEELRSICRIKTNPQEFLMNIERVGMIPGEPECREVICIMHGAHLYIAAEGIQQGVWNLRDPFKVTRRTLVLLAPEITLPSLIAQDVITIDEPLPSAEELAKIAKTLMDENEISPEDAGESIEATRSRIVGATVGLSHFTAEQVIAMSIRRKGKANVISVEDCWERKRKVVEQTPGLSMWRGDENISDIGGCRSIIEFVTRFCAGPSAPQVLVFEDEIEKQFGGVNGDSSGVSQEMLGKKLSHMQDRNYRGLLLLGPPGTGKSTVAKAIGNSAKTPTIVYNISDMKGSLVGQSSERMRQAHKVIDAVAGGPGKALFIATCNSKGSMPPELLRRYNLGTFFLDLPDEAEKAAIWAIWMRKYKLATQPMPDDKGWSGADIKACCSNAHDLGMTLKEAAAYIVSVSMTSGDKIETLRRECTGRYLSASNPGIYTMPSIQTISAEPVASTGRKLLLEREN